MAAYRVRLDVKFVADEPGHEVDMAETVLTHLLDTHSNAQLSSTGDAAVFRFHLVLDSTTLFGAGEASVDALGLAATDAGYHVGDDGRDIPWVMFDNAMEVTRLDASTPKNAHPSKAAVPESRAGRHAVMSA